MAKDVTPQKYNIITLRGRRGPRISPVKEKRAKGKTDTPLPIVN